MRKGKVGSSCHYKQASHRKTQQGHHQGRTDLDAGKNRETIGRSTLSQTTAVRFSFKFAVNRPRA